jgi:hypothetical protein
MQVYGIQRTYPLIAQRERKIFIIHRVHDRWRGTWMDDRSICSATNRSPCRVFKPILKGGESVEWLTTIWAENPSHHGQPPLLIGRRVTVRRQACRPCRVKDMQVGVDNRGGSAKGYTVGVLYFPSHGPQMCGVWQLVIFVECEEGFERVREVPRRAAIDG